MTDPSGEDDSPGSGSEKCKYCGPDVSAYYASELTRLERWVNNFQITNSWTWRVRRWGAFFDIAGGLDWWDKGEETSVTHKDCPSSECKGTVWLCGKCVGSHVMGNIAYGFVGRLLEFKWITLRAAAQLHQLAEHFEFDPPGSRAAYDLGEVIAERTKIITPRKLCRMVERTQDRFAAAWQERKDCEKCPHDFPASAWPTTYGPRGKPGGVDIDNP